MSPPLRSVGASGCDLNEKKARMVADAYAVADGYTVYESILNGFYDDMMHITAFKPYMVAVGNHEANCDNGNYFALSETITKTDPFCR